ncbi:MAG: DEAD/DEAH box helicase, partial [Myxococcota bacterium]|nr:DEAD/DEAH box helicase [Myxococcota bacterium]
MSDEEEQIPTDDGEGEAQNGEAEAHAEVFDEAASWADLGLSEPMLRALADMEYTSPTGVQAQSVPKLLTGRHLLVRSKTGTGKTSAFAIPILERIEDKARELRAIVLAPTRELALQVAAETERLAAHRDLSVVSVYGGVGLGPQADALRDGAEIVVGTPGRVLDHIRRGNMDLSKCKMVCLDEADEMLSMGFLEDVRTVLERVPDGMQMLLFSATVEADLQNLIKTYAGEPEQIFLSTD